MMVLTQKQIMNIDFDAATKARPQFISTPKNGEEARARSDEYEKQMQASVKPITG
ncbi:hypothetical protein MZJ48_004525 [Vibrio parahaemolyticus]|uniref:hypothetical protein n=1 Tax=Vibrio parahaemolyticus TaxID=670 RepID=UPI0015DF31FE|nr:hypothetical protein [Vibrio parahaemolyticus]EJC7123247.1 hypothetical protein [Vibrio parahaemolyticus]